MDTPFTVRDLRRRWKPHKLRLGNGDTSIRFHRACSWLHRAQITECLIDHDIALLSQWIAFNSLYGQWDAAAQEPMRDKVSWQRFIGRILELDQDGCVSATLVEQKPLVLGILEDEHVSQFFWKDPGDKRAQQSKKAMYEARTWYLGGNWTMILNRVMERIYFLRCQLVHGAATYQSDLNRTAVQRSAQMMGHLLPAMLIVWIDHGADEDWGSMCYPPLE
ncbi:HEPN domain-containing protein [Lignipirellula cremea]|uniref:Uncharacterized protein n=1 Tax=Lignipirellula cremea TaxID=2528010 RepID=A0A518DLL9_9BACT|nr:HEPN domain-containing protein [Lignipirellula cremea]QDU92715.1 hypothetical protein Pla8534_04630 [Lignipirellula cremea]